MGSNIELLVRASFPRGKLRYRGLMCLPRLTRLESFYSCPLLLFTLAERQCLPQRLRVGFASTRRVRRGQRAVHGLGAVCGLPARHAWRAIAGTLLPF